MENVEMEILPVDIMEVSFDGVKYWELQSDNATVTYSAPQWKDVDANGLTTNTAQGERDYAVAYTRNTKPKIGAKFLLSGASEYGVIKIKATGPDGFAIPETTANVTEDEVTLPPNTEASTPLADTIKFYDKNDEARAFKLNWEMKIGNSDWARVATTRHTVYVTLGDPVTNLRQETLFNIGCRNADGETEESAVVSSIWTDFGPDPDGVPRLLKVLPPGGAAPAAPMTYYANSEFPYLTNTNGVAGLLSTGDGRCGAFQELFISVLAVQHITATPKVALAPAIGITTAVADYLSTYGTDPALNFPIIRDVFFVKYWNLSVTSRWSATDLNGVPGQGNPDPIAIFGDHTLVEFDGKIYDPSYGAGPFTSMLEWEDSSVVGFGVQFIPFSAAASGFVLWTRILDSKGIPETITP